MYISHRFHSQICVHEIFTHLRTVSLELGDNYVSECSFDKIYITMCGQLSELHCNALLVSNSGEKLMKWRKTMG